MPYVFAPLDPSRHDRVAFSCGEPSLDAYLKTQASQDMRRDLALCYVLCERGGIEIIGYYTLSSCAVELTGLPRDITKSVGRYHSIPAVLLGRLAVATTFRGQGMGDHLLLDALRRSLHAGIAIKLVVVDALHEAAAAFYLHHGFRRFEDHPLRLYLPMAHVRQLFPTEAPPESEASPETEGKAIGSSEG